MYKIETISLELEEKMALNKLAKLGASERKINKEEIDRLKKKEKNFKVRLVFLYPRITKRDILRNWLKGKK